MSPRRWQIKLAIGCIGLVLVGWSGINYVRMYCCAPIHLRLSAGNVCPIRARMAQSMCGEIQDAGVSLECVGGTDSTSICGLVDQGKLDLGLVLGGSPTGAYPNVRQVATFGVDPLHLLVRRELAKDAANPFEMLRGRRVSLGEAGTNGALLAESLMQLAGLMAANGNKPGDYYAEQMREHDLHVALAAIRKASPENRAAFAAILPDAVFLVDSMPSPLADELVRVAGYELVALPYATALHLDHRRDHGRIAGQLEKNRLEAATIPAFAYGINPPTPAADCQTFGLQLLLVANKNASANAVLRVLRALDSGIAERFHMNLNVANQNCEFPLHPGAEAFAKGRKPLMVGELIEPVQNFFSVVGAAGAGAFAIWGFFRSLRAVHPDVYLRKIDRIERLLRGDERDTDAPVMPRDFLNYLESRLAIIKQTAIEDYSRHRLTSEEALVGILTLIADTRHLLVQRRRQLEREEACVPTHATRRADAA